jgi:hypothetical protein
MANKEETSIASRKLKRSAYPGDGVADKVFQAVGNHVAAEYPRGRSLPLGCLNPPIDPKCGAKNRTRRRNILRKLIFLNHTIELRPGVRWKWPFRFRRPMLTPSAVKRRHVGKMLRPVLRNGRANANPQAKHAPASEVTIATDP